MANFIEIWLVVAFLGFSLAVPLGPVNAEIIKQILSKSSSERLAWFAAVLTGLGAMVGDFIVAFTFLSIGGEILIDYLSNPYIKFTLFTFNILILGFLGVSALLSKPQSLEELEIETNSANNAFEKYFKKLIRQLLIGFSLVVTSPWSYGFWASAGTILLFSELNTPDLLSRLVIIVMFLSGIFIWVLIFPTILSAVGRIPDPRIFQIITKGTAVILFIFAGMMAVEAWYSLSEILSRLS
ncbi:MAG: LysE family transporter [Candidatus Hodarchaeota archaeon]